MEEAKQVFIEDIQDIIDTSHKIESQIELIKNGYTHTPDTGIDRLDVINSYESLIRSIANRMLKK